ncbi:MAG: hypothetical protein M1833_004510 [Piccolia ochrophora]|nr:MAG: hypothetical protein M1833_004510 [Piccolia ochrophora]
MTADAATAHSHEFSPPARSLSKSLLSFPFSLLSSPATLPPEEDTVASESPSPEIARSLRSIELAMLSEPDRDSFSESELSISTSTTSDAATLSKATKRSRKPKTSFHLAHPPPAVIHRQRLQFRPRILLQLQRVSGSKRTEPAFDVLPSKIFAPRVARRFPRFFKGKSGLGVDDLVITTSEVYGSSKIKDQDSSKDPEEDVSETREVVATICQPKLDANGTMGGAQVCLKSGPLWEVSPYLNGGYQFVATDDHGLRTVARWVPRNVSRTRRSVPSPHPNRPNDSDRKLTFSIVDPTTRRHPVIASMTRTRIDILDEYPSHASPGTRTPLSPSTLVEDLTTPPEDFFGAPAQDNSALTPVDDGLRTLIIVTGIWVAFSEGWSESFNNDRAISHPLPNPPSSPRSTSLPSLTTMSSRKRSSSTGSALSKLPNRGSKSTTPTRSQTTVSSTLSSVIASDDPLPLVDGPAEPPSKGVSWPTTTRPRAITNVPEATIPSEAPTASPTGVSKKRLGRLRGWFGPSRKSNDKPDPPT